MKILLLLICIPLSGFAKSYSAKELYKSYKNAVVRINVYQQGLLVSHGTGFFIDNKGTLITNDHVARHGVFTVGASLEFVLSDGKKLTKYSTAGCRDSRGIDICLLKILDYRSKTWLDIDIKHKATPGEKVYVIGHPKGYDWSISDGIFSGYRSINSGSVLVSTSKQAIEQVQVSAPISSGNSGGPIISESGKLVGMTTWIRTDSGFKI